MTEFDLMRLGRHVAEREDAALAAADGAAEGSAAASENTRRFLAEYAARPGARADARAAGEPRRESERALAGPRQGEGSRTAVARGVRLGLYLGLAALVALALLALKDLVFAPRPLSFTVGARSESGVLRDWESAPEDAPLPIRFSDGTRVTLEPGARARVLAVSERGAEIVIEAGRAQLDVVPVRQVGASESPWRVSLGPFSVEVKGTRFDVEWNPRTDEFALDLLEGSVRVSGCQEGHAHTLVAGQGVRASCSQKRWELVTASEAKTPAAPRDLGAAPAPADGITAGDGREVDAAAAPEASQPRSAATARKEAGTASERRPSARRRASNDARSSAPGPAARSAAPARGPTPGSWQALAMSGHYSAAFERALDAGFESECERVRASDLVLLGDAARLAGDAARARSAYLAARRRFDGSPAAAQAAFGLGRLSVKSDPRQAMEWFERSLREAPSGPLAAAADDWLFELAGESGSAARRREVAQSYLERHPDGAHADDARRILEADGR